MVPLFLLILIDLVFSTYQTIYSLKTEPISLSIKIAWILTILIKLIPIVVAIHYASKVTETGKQMNIFIGKVMNICDDENVLKRVNFMLFYIDTKQFINISLLVEHVYDSDAKSTTSYKCRILQYRFNSCIHGNSFTFFHLLLIKY